MTDPDRKPKRMTAAQIEGYRDRLREMIKRSKATNAKANAPTAKARGKSPGTPRKEPAP